MKVLPYVIAAALLTLAVVRRWRRRRRGGGKGEGGDVRDRRRPGARRWALGRHLPLGDTGLVAGREVRERLRGRLFRVVTLVLLAVVAAAVVIPTIHRSAPHPVTRVGVVGTVPVSVRHSIVAAAKRAGTTVVLVPEPSLPRARAALRADRVALVVEGSERVLVATAEEGSGSTAVGALAQSVATVVGIERAFDAAGLSPAQVATVAGAKPVPVQSLEPATAPNGAARSTSVIGLVLVFVMLTQYLTWTLMGVLEEKTSRVVEVLLATVRPIQLLGGKVLGIGLVALSQAGIVVAFALVLARAVGSDLLHGTAPLVVAATLAWLVLGYAFYSWVYAAAGSMSARQDQVQSLALPLSVPMIVGYVVGLVGASQASPSLLVTVFAYLPLTAPFDMPVLVGQGAVTWWEFLASALLSIAATVVIARLAAAVYRRAVLQTGRRLTVKELVAAVRSPRGVSLTARGG